jgi:anti-sigma factor RsiW
MTDIWIDRLSDYIDGELTPADRAALEAHLAGCRDCANALTELREVVARAAALTPRPPGADLWPGVESRIDAPRIDMPRIDARAMPHANSRPPAIAPFRPRAARRVSFTVPQFVAASLALALVSGGGVWVLNHGGRATSIQPIAAAPNAGVLPASFADPHYDEAIADLQQTLQDGRGQLDPQTVKILEANLDAIDTAIDQCRQALASDPGNLYLHNHLAEARQRKLALLRRAAAIVNKG